MITDVTHCILKCLFKALFGIKDGVNGFHITLNLYTDYVQDNLRELIFKRLF